MPAAGVDATEAHMAQSKLSFEDYDGFVEKFKPKRTTDDCMTPPEIYEVVASYVEERFGVERSRFVRPFWPGGDCEAFDYPDGCVFVEFDYQSDRHCAKTLRMAALTLTVFDYQSDRHCA